MARCAFLKKGINREHLWWLYTMLAYSYQVRPITGGRNEISDYLFRCAEYKDVATIWRTFPIENVLQKGQQKQHEESRQLLTVIVAEELKSSSFKFECIRKPETDLVVTVLTSSVLRILGLLWSVNEEVERKLIWNGEEAFLGLFTTSKVHGVKEAELSSIEKMFWLVSMIRDVKRFVNLFRVVD